MMKEIYIVTAYRWGDREGHSYNLGAFGNLYMAKKAALSHADYRGGKYACVVERCYLNHFDNDLDEYTEEVFRAKSMGD